jgi:glycosyltransferase involved in cell wall biosynthesis
MNPVSEPSNFSSKTVYYVCAVDISNYDAQRTHILEVVSAWHNTGIDVILYLPQFSDNPEPLAFPHKYLPVWFQKSKFKYIEYEIRLGIYLFFSMMKNKPQVIYIRKGFLTILPAILARLFNIKCVLEVNGFVGDDLHLGFGIPGFITRLFVYQERLTCLLADRIITVTSRLRQLIAYTHNIDAANIRVISNGVNIDRFKPAEKNENDNFYLGFVGNLVPWSGLDYLLYSLAQIIKQYPDIKCLIVGDGTYRDQMEKLAESLNISKSVVFVGSVRPGQVPGYINRCHICYLPAIRQRNARIGISPLKIYEYLACGIPVIVSDISGMEIVAKYEVGLVVEPENTAALTRATLELITNPDVREEMSHKARELAERVFSWEKIAREILNVFEFTDRHGKSV